MKLKRYILSVVGNKIIKFVLGINCDEFTSAYRGFNLNMLKNFDINGVSSRGYSFFMETLFELDQRNVPIDEIPITFNERKHGVSKIPQIEIFRTLKKIFVLVCRKLLKSKKTLEEGLNSQDFAPHRLLLEWIPTFTLSSGQCFC